MESIIHFLLTPVNYIIKLWQRFAPPQRPSDRVMVWSPRLGAPTGFRARDNVPVWSSVCGGRAIFVQRRNNGIYLLMFQLLNGSWTIPGSTGQYGNLVTEADGADSRALANAALRAARSAWAATGWRALRNSQMICYSCSSCYAGLGRGQYNCLLIIPVAPFTPEPTSPELDSEYSQSAWMSLASIFPYLDAATENHNNFFANYDTYAAVIRFWRLHQM